MKCPYCDEEYEDRHGRDMCVASHFSGEKKLPKTSINRNKDVNLIRIWKKDEVFSSNVN